MRLPFGMGVPFDVPVVPDQPEGQDWVIEELSKPQYQAARIIAR